MRTITPPRKTDVRSVLTALGLPFLLLAALLPAGAAPKGVPGAEKPAIKRLLMAHYMPWFQAKPFSAQWGWHWTMGHFDPDAVKDGRRGAASRFTPLIGLYDSGDPEALQCQALLMKLSGIDGVIFDWYGHDDYYDYAAVNRNVERMLPILRRTGLRFAICYETQTIVQEIKGGVFPEAGAVAHGQRLMTWMQANFFSQPNYLTLAGRPVLLTFGDPYYKNDQWEQVFSGLTSRPLFFTEQDRQEPTASVGAFAWPQPGGGLTGAAQKQEEFFRRAQGWPYSIAAAYPRFDDIYAEAGVHPSWGHIDDEGGRTYTDTLTGALQSQAAVVQLVTWNDWGEGTQIEPSVEFGYRDLETTQRLRRQFLDPSFSGTGSDLRLPVRWYLLCKKHAGDPKIHAKLAAFVSLMLAGHRKQAQALLEKYGST